MKTKRARAEAIAVADSADDIIPVKRRRPRQTRDQLRGKVMGVATKLFAEQGYGGLTIREIAQEAELALTVLYRFFIDKRDLYVQCCREAIEKDIVNLNRSVEDIEDNEQIIFNFTTALLRRRMDSDIPHIVTRAIFDGDIDIVDEKLHDLFQADFFQKTLKASSALIDDDMANSRVLYIYSLAFGLPRLMPLWEKHIMAFDGGKDEIAMSGNLLKMLYPGFGWDRLVRTNSPTP